MIDDDEPIPLPSGAVWYGTAEELALLFDAIFTTCAYHGGKDRKGWSPTYRLSEEGGHCGRMAGACSLCAMMEDQKMLDRLAFTRWIREKLIEEEGVEG